MNLTWFAKVNLLLEEAGLGIDLLCDDFYWSVWPRDNIKVSGFASGVRERLAGIGWARDNI
jgi:hypothetical protein